MFTLKQIKANAGITMDKEGNALAYKRGYQVSEQDLAIIPVYKLRKSKLIEMLNSLPAGKERKQLSIWNWKASEAIAC